MRHFTWTICVVMFLTLAGLPPVGMRAQRGPSPGEWRYFGGDKGFTRYSPLDQIRRDNVANLRIVWRRPAADPEWKKAFPDLRILGNLRST